jgi:hypothetical protein
VLRTYDPHGHGHRRSGLGQSGVGGRGSVGGGQSQGIYRVASSFPWLFGVTYKEPRLEGDSDSVTVPAQGQACWSEIPEVRAKRV